ncbi:MAG TPA: phenylacetate--CoA ligase, partial [Candidatus Lokiarchaeia archaeon]|nr:phenylacetate--CoA ligase [Candidatus Lokiarchaeia archaeon]
MTDEPYLYWEEHREKMPLGEMAALQLRKGKWTLKRLFDLCKPIRDKYDAAGITPDDVQTLDDFHKIPFMEKTDFLDAYPDKLLTVPMHEIVRMHCTSGTSGKRPTTGFYTANDLDAWTTLIARNLTAVGITKYDVFQNTTSSGLFTGGYGYTQGATRVGCCVIPFGGGMTEKQIQFFQDFKVTAIHAIPSFGLRIMEVCEQLGVDPKNDLVLKKAVLGAEGWSEATRTRIQDASNVRCYDNYGLTEAIGPGVSVECVEQNGMHIWSDYFYPEVIDPETGENVGEDEYGELVLTSLFKEAVPIFRYRTGDITRLYKSECPCGRTGYMMERIVGRRDDMKVIKGVNLYPSMIEEEIYKRSDLTDQYMIIYHTVGVMDQVDLQVEARGDANKEIIKEDLEKVLHEDTMLGVRVSVLDERTLPQTEGKQVRYKDLRDVPDG